MPTNALTNTSADYLGFNLSPTATSGQGAYGLVPGQIGAPVTNWSQLMQNVPGMSDLTNSVMTNMQAGEAGTLGPGTMGTLQDKAAAFGIANTSSPFTGSPSVPLANYLESIGTSSEALTNSATSNYLNFTGTAGGMQWDPSSQLSTATNNAAVGAAPDPSQAVSAEQQWIQQYMQMMNPARGNSASYNPAGNTGIQYPSSVFNQFTAGGGGGSYSGNPYSVYSTGGYGQDNVDMSGFYS